MLLGYTVSGLRWKILHLALSGDYSGSPWCHRYSLGAERFADWAWRSPTPVWLVAYWWQCLHSQSDPVCTESLLWALLQCVNRVLFLDDQKLSHQHLDRKKNSGRRRQVLRNWKCNSNFLCNLPTFVSQINSWFLQARCGYSIKRCTRDQQYSLTWP